jgi:hypothetical protein
VFYWPSWLDEAGFQKARTMLEGHLSALKAAGFPADHILKSAGFSDFPKFFIGCDGS